VRRLRIVTLVTLLAVLGTTEVGAVAEAFPALVRAAPGAPSPDDQPTAGADDEAGSPEAPGTVPLIPVPSGCTAPEMPDVVFVGRVVARDFRTARFRIEQVRAGDETPFAADGLIDVRYGIDVDYLEEDRPYLVAARQDPVLGVLASSIRESLPDFAGDDVISVTESDVSCPVFEDQVRTLLPDGSPVESGVFAPLQGSGIRMLGAFGIPLGITFAVVFVLAMLRLAVSGVATGVDRALDRRRT
jgi:hypothetical protein